MNRQAVYEELTNDALRLAPRIARALPASDAAEVRQLAGECRRATGKHRTALAMTITRIAITDLGPAHAALLNALFDLEAAWVDASRVRRKHAA